MKLCLFGLLVSSCSHTEARVRNATIGADQASELRACRDDAKRRGAGPADRWLSYTVCADAVDARHGKVVP